jgi:carboxymethylenebutenolidase
MPVYYARPSNGQKPPIILVCMEVFGLHEWVKDITRRVGHLGAFGVAPNYYFRYETHGADLTKIDDIHKLLPIVNGKTDAELYADLDATVASAKAQGGDGSRLGIIGFCRGGRNVWHYSTHNPDLKAGVAFYGSLIDRNDVASKNSIELAAEVKEPVLGLYGADDSGIKIEQVKRNAGRTEGRRQDGGVSYLSWRAPRIRRRLPRKLSQGSSRRCLEPDDRLVQKIQCSELIRSESR